MFLQFFIKRSRIGNVNNVVTRLIESQDWRDTSKLFIKRRKIFNVPIVNSRFTIDSISTAISVQFIKIHRMVNAKMSRLRRKSRIMFVHLVITRHIVDVIWMTTSKLCIYRLRTSSVVFVTIRLPLRLIWRDMSKVFIKRTNFKIKDFFQKMSVVRQLIKLVSTLPYNCYCYFVDRITWVLNWTVLKVLYLEI